MTKEIEADLTLVKPDTTREEIRRQALLISERLLGRKATPEEIEAMDAMLAKRFGSENLSLIHI